MRTLIEMKMLSAPNAELLYVYESIICRVDLFEKKSTGKSPMEKFKEQHGIVGKKASSGHCVHSIGFSEREQKWYG